MDGASEPQQQSHLLPLCRTTNEIRLIRIITVPESGAVQLKIKRVSLDSAPEYVALSYEWGDEHPKHPVLLREVETRSQISVEIRDNLYKFLKAFKADKTTWYWIDQICICQADVRERNHQVARMPQLYTGASLVRIWAGEAIDSGRHTAALPGYFASCREVLDNARNTNVWPRMKQRRDDATNATLKEGEPHLHGLREIFQNTYWTRLWICQEVLLARRAVFRCGPGGDCLWDDIARWLLDMIWLGQASVHILVFEKDGPSDPASLCAMKLAQGHEAYSESKGDLSWTYAAGMAKACACADLRDRVYGMLGLLSEEHRLEPDYDLTTIQLQQAIMSRQLAGFRAKWSGCTVDDTLKMFLNFHLDWSDILCTGPMEYEEGSWLVEFTRRELLTHGIEIEDVGAEIHALHKRHYE